MKFEAMTFSEEQVRTIYAILNEALIRNDAHTWLGSMTIDEGFDIRFRIKYADYARRHGKRVEDLTSEDLDDFEEEEYKNHIREMDEEEA